MLQMKRELEAQKKLGEKTSVQAQKQKQLEKEAAKIREEFIEREKKLKVWLSSTLPCSASVSLRATLNTVALSRHPFRYFASLPTVGSRLSNFPTYMCYLRKTTEPIKTNTTRYCVDKLNILSVDNCNLHLQITQTDYRLQITDRLQ